MTKKVGVGRAHSKIILIGEHAVVYGYPALALPLTNIEVTCRILPSDHAWILYEEDTLSMAVFASLEFLGVQEAYIRCEIESMVPEKRGMGYEQELDRETLEILANRAEMIAHMNPSGLDAKTCLSDHAIKFIKNVGFSEFETNLGAYLLIADTGIYGHTREAIQKVESIGRRALPHLHQLGKLTNEVEEALKVKDLERIGIAMSEAHLSLKNLGVSCQFG